MIMQIEKVFNLHDALVSLRPECKWVATGFDYSGIEWSTSNTETLPTEAELITERDRLQSEYNALKYQRDRKPEYPPIEDYIDGVVKGNQAQIDAYIAACLAVKAQFPKPE